MYTRELIYRLSDKYKCTNHLIIHLKTFREKQWLVAEPSRTRDKDIKCRTLLDIPGHIIYVLENRKGPKGETHTGKPLFSGKDQVYQVPRLFYILDPHLLERASGSRTEKFLEKGPGKQSHPGRGIKSWKFQDIYTYVCNTSSISNYEPFNISQITVVEIFTQILSFVTCAKDIRCSQSVFLLCMCVFYSNRVGKILDLGN